MAIETRPALNGLPEDQRLLAMAHWYLFRLLIEQPEALGYCWPASVTPDVLLRQMEGGMQQATRCQIALARGRYWREVHSRDH